jgi:hypothetical protein
MTTHKDWVLDKKHGRQGGHRTEHEPIDFAGLPACSPCGGLLALGQPGAHWSCLPVCDGCHRPVAEGRNCQCPRGRGAS